MKTSRAPRPNLPADTSHDLDTTDHDLAELLAMWPRLQAAIGVDVAGPSAAPTSSGENAGQGSPSPVHLDTQAVMALIDVGLRKLEGQVAAVLRTRTTGGRLREIRAKIEAEQQRRAVAKASARRISRIQDADRALTVDEHITMLEALDTWTRAGASITLLRSQAAELEQQQTVAGLLTALRLHYPQLADRGHPLARDIQSQVVRWRRDARLALGLTTRPRPIGHRCPYHDPAQAPELVREPHEAVLSKAVIAGAQPRSGGPLSWRRSETVTCPRCRRTWTGIAALRTLMKILDRTELEAFVANEVSKAINDEHLHTTLYRCPKCEGTSSSTAWDNAWLRRQAELLGNGAAQAVLDELAAHALCPRCRSVVDVSDVEELDGIAVVLP